MRGGRVRKTVACLTAVLTAGALLAAPQEPETEVPLTPSIVDRFLSSDPARVTSYRAVRHLHATSRGGKMTASMTALTTLDPIEGFQFVVLESSGSGLIKNRVFLPALEAEREAKTPAAEARGALSMANYEFLDKGQGDEGLMQIGIRPKRKDTLLIDGSILVTPEADLVRVEGRLVKRPSFWTRRVEVVRRYERLEGVRVPVEMRSSADVLIGGKSTFVMTYDYTSVNGRGLE
jgi:hypothetical protein